MSSPIYVITAVAVVFNGTVARADGHSSIIRQIESEVDHNHCTTRQFQHKTFFHQGVWFVFYSDGKDFQYQTSTDHGRNWQRAEQPIDTAPNGSTSFDMLKIGDHIYISHALYPLGRYDVRASYARDPAKRGAYPHEGRIKQGHIEGRTIRWGQNVHLGFTPDYSNLVRDSAGYFWIVTRESEQGVAYRSRRPNDITDWTPSQVCMPVAGRHALDTAAISDGQLFVVSTLTTSGQLYGNLYDGRKWSGDPVLIADNMTQVAGDDRRMSIEFDPTNGRLHLIYVDSDGRLRYRFLDAPYHSANWLPAVSDPGTNLVSNVFTCALSVDSSQAPYGLVITYGRQKHLGRDKRQRTGELFARRFDGQQWRGPPVLVSEPETIHNWYPNVNQDVCHGLCAMYSRSLDKANLGQPLAIMVSVLGNSSP